MIQKLLIENARRQKRFNAIFDPISGQGSVGERKKVIIPDSAPSSLWLPKSMLREPFVKRLLKAGSFQALAESLQPDHCAESASPKNSLIPLLKEQFLRIRIRHDFPFWAAAFIWIKAKGGGADVHFRLTYPQRKFVAELERCRLAGKPIRLVLLKARQWGGSTTSQLYMAWLQFVHSVGLNSLIIAHQGAGSDEIKDMFDRAIKAYPIALLHPLGDSYDENEPKLTGVGKSGSIHRVPQRNCKIKIGTAERPDSCRGGDYNLVHLSEVGIWKKTEGKSPEDIVRAACSGVMYKPMTMIVYESTANGTGNFFHREYVDARDNPQSQFRAMFVGWHEIEQNQLPLEDPEAFAKKLWEGRNNTEAPSAREEAGAYLWWLWQLGATLEGINWYIMERARFTSHGAMAAECPSDDVEAFVNSGASVFDKYAVEALRPDCRIPRVVGEVVEEGVPDRLSGAPGRRRKLGTPRFEPDSQGCLKIWQYPDPCMPDDPTRITNRYLVVVDVGGRSSKADWSVIVIFDRLELIDAGKPVVVAQWRGHTDMDLLAWKAALIAKWYDNALLVIESNTLETHDRERLLDGDQSLYILNQVKDAYNNLYARPQSEDEIRQKLPKKYGFHTNVSTKPMIISTLIRAVREHAYTERDEEVLKEFICYERKPNGAYGAIDGEHDDLLMTRAIALHVCLYDMDMPREIPNKRPSPIHPRRPLTESSIG